MRIIPVSKHEYKVFPIEDTDPYIEITRAEYDGLESFDKCFSDDLTEVVDYVKSDNELKIEDIERKNMLIIEQINDLKDKLRQSDYKALKFMEGELTAEEYAETKQHRREWRTSINDLENQIIMEGK